MIRQRAASRDRIALFVALLTLVSTGAASAQSPTFARRDYPSLGSDHLVADFNGDGKLDLAGLGVNAAALVLGNGDGTFQPRVEFPVAGSTQALAAGDFNRDGALDLIVTINSPTIGLALLRGRGNGTFDRRALPEHVGLRFSCDCCCRSRQRRRAGCRRGSPDRLLHGALRCRAHRHGDAWPG